MTTTRRYRMKASKKTIASPPLLIKSSLAEQLKNEIVRGNLPQGSRIIEKFWASKFGVAQTSVREAINILISEGFATKNSGRSARVSSYSPEKVAQIYEVRAALEGMAARILTQSGQDLSALEHAIANMAKSIKSKDLTALLEADLRFHLQLCELTGNEVLSQHARMLLVPLFAFVSMRLGGNATLATAWKPDLERHRAMVRAIAEGEASIAELTVRNAILRFADHANQIWR
ncbi:GntR family transcriptional regulator [Edaphobacter albus]|uniref:GntR family transcriptional regulator n=1 Tax=Edaphobacter sp. 4G125 TaxID=2763071 RepID=UPI0016496230|nr:GntR family transcriptional regulator [Edaphobacter sp. 4G125]QNI38185.1 GntR family transcriptional regulator [Edaphobacter sp. 4G125]